MKAFVSKYALLGVGILLLFSCTVSLGVTNKVVHQENEKIKSAFAKETKKYAILVVAGQSNAVGYDESPVTTEVVKQMNPRLKQLGLYDKHNLQVIPLTHAAQNFKDMRRFKHPASKGYLGTKGIHLPLGNALLPYIPKDYELVIIPAAYGGAGFTANKGPGKYDPINLKPADSHLYNWGVNSVYYKAMKDRIKYVLNLNSSNYYIATIWCQGEKDATAPSKHKVAFEEMTQDFFNDFNKNYPNRVRGSNNWGKEQWFTYETVPYWQTKYKHSSGVNEIWKNYEEWSPSTYVSIHFGNHSAIYTNETNGTGETSSVQASHYGNDAFSNLVVPAIINKMLEAKAIEPLTE